MLVAAVGALAGGLVLFLDAHHRRPQPDTAAADTVPAAPLADLDWIHPADNGGSGLDIALHTQLGSFTLNTQFTTTATTIGILGPSGSGKSLTMRAIAGLLPVTGTVRVGTATLTDTHQGITMPPQTRRLGYVAQPDALFDHLDVTGNITFGIRHLPVDQRHYRLHQLLSAVGATHLPHARPARLSGGERQRVALARALAPGPRALLLDEAFANLDTTVRGQLRDLVRRLHDRTGIPVVIVTHDREDVLDIADYLVVMAHGQVLQHGPTVEVFRRPTTAIAAQLVGISNILPVQALTTGPDDHPVTITDWGPLPLTSVNIDPAAAADQYQIAIPTDAITLTPTGIPAKVEVSRPAVQGHRLRLRTPNSPHLLETLLIAPEAQPPAPGDTVGVRIDPSRCHLLSATPPTSTHTSATTTPNDPTVTTHHH